MAWLEAKALNPDSRRAPQVWNSEGPGSEGWWVRRLLNSLECRSELHNVLWDYYEGRHPLPWIHDLELIPQFDRLQRIAKTNYLALTLEAVEERLDVEGFRFGDEQAADEDAWETWQENDLDELSQLAHVMAFVTGTAYTLTWPGDDGPDVWVEDSLNMVHEWDTSRPRGRQVAAALKAWHDDQSGIDRLELYLPDGIHRWSREQTRGRDARWEPAADEDGRPQFEESPDEFRALDAGGIVPVTPLIAKPDRHRNGRSELIDAIPVQDRINQSMFDRLVSQSYSSFEQVIASGTEPVYDETTNQRIPNPALKRSPGRTMELGENGTISTIAPASIQQMIDAIDQDIGSMARMMRTPPNYLSAKMQFPSGDAIRGAEAGLVKKAMRRSRQLGGGWERTVRLAMAAMGDVDRARIATVETVWKDVEIRTEGERVDALLKMATLGVPAEVLWERWGATQTEIRRWRSLRDADAFTRGLADVVELPTTRGMAFPDTVPAAA